MIQRLLPLVACCLLAISLPAQEDDKTLRVFIFAGQSNMVGSDSKVRDIERFPPYSGLGESQKDVLFSYCIGRENKIKSDGWEKLAPVDGVVGPELSFAREVRQHVKAPIAIIKVAAGGTHLIGDWNPDQPRGFEMYPLALSWVREALAELDRKKIDYRLEGFVWHQGENDMFEEGAMPVYGANLANFLMRWRTDLDAEHLRFYIGELCTKTIWGMDMRPRMDAIAQGQKKVAAADPLAQYVRTSHVGVEIGGGVGLHYHYGTLGQLQHGLNYAHAYLRNLDVELETARSFKKWPYPAGSKIKLFVLAGHRNMEGERAFAQELKSVGARALAKDQSKIAFRYSLGGAYKVSGDWEPLGLTGYYDTFGPELSFGARLSKKMREPIAIAKFTHSGSQIIDWTPQGSEAEARNLYPAFIAFVQESIADLHERGHEVELTGIFYHVGENDMSFGPYRRDAAKRLAALVSASRDSLNMPELPWYVSQQEPTDDERVNTIDVAAEIETWANSDPHTTLIQAFKLAGREQKLVITTEGIVELGELLANTYLKR